MPVIATKECWSDIFKGLIEVGFLGKGSRFNLEWEGEDIKITFPKKLYKKLKDDLDRGKPELQKFLYLRECFKKKPRGENCKVVVKRKGKHLADIHYLLFTALTSLRAEKRQRIFGARKKAEEDVKKVLQKFFSQKQLSSVKSIVYYKKGMFYLDVCFGRKRRIGLPYRLVWNTNNVNAIPVLLAEYLSELLSK